MILETLLPQLEFQSNIEDAVKQKMIKSRRQVEEIAATAYSSNDFDFLLSLHEKNAIPGILRELHFDEVYTLEIAFLQSFCIMEVCGGGACLWLYPEHPDSGFPIYATGTTSHKRNLRRR